MGSLTSVTATRPPFRLTEDERDGAVVLRFAGEYELAGAKAVEEYLARVEATRPPLLILDLRELSFIDSTALGQLVAAAKRARSEARRLVVVRPRGHTRRVFEITLLDRAFEMVDEPEQAFGEA